jgi:hypothetical protein
MSYSTRNLSDILDKMGEASSRVNLAHNFNNIFRLKVLVQQSRQLKSSFQVKIKEYTSKQRVQQFKVY